MTTTLSPREQEIAQLIGDDLSDKEIAHILRISPRTVQAYLDRIIRKLHIDRSQLTRRRLIRRAMLDAEQARVSQ